MLVEMEQDLSTRHAMQKSHVKSDNNKAFSPKCGFIMTTAKENYLKVIFNLVSHGQQAHVSQIAEKLNITRASVSRAIKGLQNERLIDHQNYGPVYLTIDGMKIAKMMINRNQMIQDFLTNFLEIDPDTAQKDACQIEHTISHVTTVQLAKYLHAKR